MKNAKNCRNKVELIGEVIEGLSLSNQCKNVKMYIFKINVPRKSGAIDEIPVMISNVVLDNIGIEITEGAKYRIIGEYRSVNKLDENSQKNKLLLYVLAKHIEIYEESDSEEEITNNHVQLEGYVAKVSQLRITPYGKKVMDIMLAVNRNEYKSSYIPCIVWYPNEYLQNAIQIGAEVSIFGRIQSREYVKKINDENEEKKVAYEVSVKRIYIENQNYVI